MSETNRTDIYVRKNVHLFCPSLLSQKVELQDFENHADDKEKQAEEKAHIQYITANVFG